MLTLSLLRHAKSSWADPSLKDFDRPLASRGRKAAPLMAQALIAETDVPDVVLCSPAVRTRQTLALVLAAVGDRLPRVAVHYDQQLYHGHPDDLLAVLVRAAGPPRHAMIIGHNPGLQDFALGLCADRADPRAVAMAAKFPTAALAIFDFEGIDTWAEVRGHGRVRAYVTPASLAARSAVGPRST